jgi:hypothetical protein
MADKTFTKVINFYPETEMAETARWMRDNLGDELPEFQNVDELNKRVQEQND